jgi:hypothetical protein
VTLKGHAVNTTSKLDLASSQSPRNRRVHQVLETRPMSLDEAPAALRFNANQRTAQVLQAQPASLQRSLF